MKSYLRTIVALVALGACSGSEPVTGPDPLDVLSFDPAFDITAPADGGTCPNVYYEATELLENGATVTWTNVIGGFDYELGSDYLAEVRWSVEDGSGVYVDFTTRNGPNTWTPRFGKNGSVDGTMGAGSPGAGFVPITVSMDPMKSVGGSGDGDEPDDWSGLTGTGHFWLRLDVENGEGETESVKLGVNFHLEDPADGFEPRCPGTDPGAPVPPPPPPPPPATEYTVGGTVSGLTGTVSLLNNGGDALSVTSNGSFTFLTSLGDGSAYAVTVGTQPDGQTCAVSSGSGTITGADVTDVSVTCADDPSPPPPPPPASTVFYAADIQPFFNSSCISCHQGDNPPKGVNLTSYQQLTASDVVVPSDPDGSVLVQQLEGGHRSQDVSASDITMIRTWIQEGAQNN